mgnify:CR=1 FL=1
MLVKVTGTNFVRDTGSMGLINNDDSARNEYYSKVRMLKTQKDEINKVKSEMESIKSDVLEIKEMMRQLLNKGTNG